MAELSKTAKIVILINVIACVIYGVLFLIIPDIYYAMAEFKPYCKNSAMQVGSIFVVLAVFGVIALKINDFAQVKLF